MQTFCCLTYIIKMIVSVIWCRPKYPAKW